MNSQMLEEIYNQKKSSFDLLFEYLKKMDIEYTVCYKTKSVSIYTNFQPLHHGAIDKIINELKLNMTIWSDHILIKKMSNG